jgi:hypothetical protein
MPKQCKINFHFLFLASILGISRIFIFIAKVGIKKKKNSSRFKKNKNLSR